MSRLSWRRCGQYAGHITDGDRELARYSWDPGANHPHFADVRPLQHSGVLTNHAPWDHPWHHGLWWSWKYLNGVLYWENDPEYGGEHNGLGHSTVTRHQVEAADGSVRISQSLRWSPLASGTPVLTEERRLSIGITKTGWYIDWDLSFTATLPVQATVTPYPQVAWGGYAGLNYRPARSLAAGETIIAAGGACGRDAVHGQPLPWCAYLGRADDAGTGNPNHPAIGGMALLSHPHNPRHPMPAYAFSAGTGAFGFLALAPLMHEPLHLAPGDQSRMRFRSLILGTANSADDLEAEYNTYST